MLTGEVLVVTIRIKAKTKIDHTFALQRTNISKFGLAVKFQSFKIIPMYILEPSSQNELTSRLSK